MTQTIAENTVDRAKKMENMKSISRKEPEISVDLPNCVVRNVCRVTRLFCGLAVKGINTLLVHLDALSCDPLCMTMWERYKRLNLL